MPTRHTQPSHIPRSLPIDLRNLVVENADQKGNSHERPTTDNTDSNERRDRGQSVDKASAKVVRETTINTLKVLSEPVKESTPRNGIVEPDLRKENAFQEPLVESGGGLNSPSIEDEPPQSRENHVDTTNNSVDGNVPHRALHGLVTQRRTSPLRDPPLLSDRPKGGEKERADKEDPIQGAPSSVDVGQPNVLADATDRSLLFFDEFPWCFLGLGLRDDGRWRPRRARLGRYNGDRLNQFFGIRDLGAIFILLAGGSTRVGQTVDNPRRIECFAIALELNTAIIESDNVTGTGSTQLNVMRDENDGTSLHEFSTQALGKEVVGSMSVDSRQHVIQE